MCGRIFQTLPLKRLLQIARTSKVSNEELHSASFNVCPTTYIPVIKKSHLYPQSEKDEQKQAQAAQKPQMEKGSKEQNMDENGEDEKMHQDRELSFMKWGHKTNFNMIINGRIEQLSSKRTFMKMIENRCVVIMEGYYEWKSKQQPFSFKPKKGDHFLVAGLYSEENQIIILTKDAVAPLNQVHQRMPVMLAPHQIELWLDPKNTKDILNIIQKSILDKQKPLWKNVGFAQVAPYVNKREQKSVKCLMTMEEYKKELDKTGLMRFWKKKEPVQKVGKDGQTLKQKAVNGNKQQIVDRIPEKKIVKQSEKPQDKQKQENNEQ